VVDVVLAQPYESKLIACEAKFIPFDHESSVDDVEPYVMAALVAALSQRLSTISLTTLTERVAPHYALYGTKAQGRLRRRIGEAARRIATSDNATFRYSPTSGNHDGHVRFLRSPEDNDPRGRTQAYQRLARLGQARLTADRREASAQASLLDELDRADVDNGDDAAPVGAVEAEEMS